MKEMDGLSSSNMNPNEVVDCDNSPNAGKGIAVDGISSIPYQTVSMEVKGWLSSMETIQTLVFDCEEALEVLGTPNREMVFDSCGFEVELLNRLCLASERVIEEVHIAVGKVVEWENPTPLVSLLRSTNNIIQVSNWVIHKAKEGDAAQFGVFV